MGGQPVKKILVSAREISTYKNQNTYKPYRCGSPYGFSFVVFGRIALQACFLQWMPSTACHQAQLGVGLWQNQEIKNPYKWGSSTIAHILQKHEYLGHTVNFKTRKHFKDIKSHYVDKGQWLIFEDAHEPIIAQETFDNVQRVRGQVRCYPNGWGEAHPLTGLMYCDDCGGKMYVYRVNNGKHVPMYVCGNYAKTASRNTMQVSTPHQSGSRYGDSSNGHKRDYSVCQS